MARLLVLFFASGCAALIYETVWFYLVQLVVGASSMSIAVMLCAFMGGMALGSWLLPKAHAEGRAPIPRRGRARGGHRALRNRDPDRAALHPAGLSHARRTWRRRDHASRGRVLLVLTPPTMLMGATLPAIARRASSARQAAESVGLLYMANLAGGATGTLLAGFYLLRVYDTVIATAVAVTMNIVVAIARYGESPQRDSRHVALGALWQAPQHRRHSHRWHQIYARRSPCRALPRLARRSSGRGSCLCSSAPASTPSR